MAEKGWATSSLQGDLGYSGTLSERFITLGLIVNRVNALTEDRL